MPAWGPERTLYYSKINDKMPSGDSIRKKAGDGGVAGQGPDRCVPATKMLARNMPSREK
jgi:hypothetical protein